MDIIDHFSLKCCCAFASSQRSVKRRDEAFRLFWRSRDLVGKMIALMSPVVTRHEERAKRKAGETRVSDALLGGRDDPRKERDEPDIEIDARFTLSPQERLRTLDFEQMSMAEMAEARRMLARLTLPVRPLPSRRTVADALGARPDWRGTLRASLRQLWEKVEQRCKKS